MEEELLVKEAFGLKGSWNLENISFPFPLDIIIIIKGILRSSATLVLDNPRWGGSTDGKFSSWHAFQILSCSTGETTSTPIKLLIGFGVQMLTSEPNIFFGSV